MTDRRDIKLLQWHCMIQLEEAGEEDACSLVNQMMSLNTYFGTGQDLDEYLQVIDNLLAMKEIQLVGADSVRTLGGVRERNRLSDYRDRYLFDFLQGIWVWQLDERLSIEVI